jgi:hypothetical protein
VDRWSRDVWGWVFSMASSGRLVRMAEDGRRKTGGQTDDDIYDMMKLCNLYSLERTALGHWKADWGKGMGVPGWMSARHRIIYWYIAS